MNREIFERLGIVFPEEKPATVFDSTPEKDGLCCIIEICQEKRWVHLLCRKHYRHFHHKRQSVTRCSQTGCPRQAHRRGLCQKHLTDDVRERRKKMKDKPPQKCRIGECGGGVYRKKHGLCLPHYKRVMRQKKLEIINKPEER